MSINQLTGILICQLIALSIHQLIVMPISVSRLFIKFVIYRGGRARGSRGRPAGVKAPWG
jgi:hypothetical protein